MKRNSSKSGILNAENMGRGKRYVRRDERLQERREAVHSAWQEISQIGKCGLN